MDAQERGGQPSTPGTGAHPHDMHDEGPSDASPCQSRVAALEALRLKRAVQLEREQFAIQALKIAVRHAVTVSVATFALVPVTMQPRQGHAIRAHTPPGRLV